ncbi:MAG: DUF4215 domain-containing protein [Deltaproteobacteria bacterium]|nr:DUF4215 domain-containing protein [Deltaproteobacteria bacterium]
MNQESEQCDDGNTSNTDACTNACHLAVCGDGFVRVGVETCDDSNTESGDGCSATCQTETPAGCGNGTKEGDEECDDGNTTAGDKCSPICKIETGCSIGFWGQHLDVWVAPYTPTGSFVGDVFTIPACLSTCTQPQATDTFLTALTGYSGANNCDNNARNLVRQAVGAVLNVQNPALNYPVAPFSNLVAQVNAALASCNGTTMATLTGTLSTYNVYEYESPTNNVCPGQGNPFP